MDFVQSQLVSVYEYYTAVTGTTRCLATAGSMDYMSDPCCNVTLQYDQCCAPRTVNTLFRGSSPNQDAVLSMCQTGQCSLQSVSEFAQVQASLGDSRLGCDAVVNSVTSDPGFSNTQISRCLLSCVSLSLSVPIFCFTVMLEQSRG